MPGKQWKLELDDRTYSVKVEHGNMVRSFAVSVDGQQVTLKDNVMIEHGNRLAFDIEGRLCYILVILTGPKTFEYDLILDGYSVQSKRKVALPPEVREESGLIKHFLLTTIIGILVIGIVSYISNNVGKPGTGLAKSASTVLILLAVGIFLFVTVKRRRPK